MYGIVEEESVLTIPYMDHFWSGARSIGTSDGDADSEGDNKSGNVDNAMDIIDDYCMSITEFR